MGGVPGDVVALVFRQTTIMEMGRPPPVPNARPAMWVKSRQYTGRTVKTSNAKVFDEPIFNYTREFPYVWEEMTVTTSTSRPRPPFTIARRTVRVQAVGLWPYVPIEPNIV
jgi:small-conductance mechanosensitive channel